MPKLKPPASHPVIKFVLDPDYQSLVRVRVGKWLEEIQWTRDTRVLKGRRAYAFLSFPMRHSLYAACFPYEYRVQTVTPTGGILEALRPPQETPHLRVFVEFDPYNDARVVAVEYEDELHAKT